MFLIVGRRPYCPNVTKKLVTRWDNGKLVALDPYREAGTTYDFLSNDFLGYGTSRDKLTFGTFISSLRLSDGELDALYYSDDVASRIVNLAPSEMLRAGYTVVAKDQQAARALQLKGKDLGLDLALLRGMQWGRLRGGAVCLIGARDGTSDLSLPLDLKRVRDVAYLNVVDRRFVNTLYWQDDPFRPGYGMPEVYSVGGSQTAGAVSVHASRLIRFDGVQETDPVTRRALGGWTFSCLQRAYDVLRKFATAYESAAQLIADASQGVWSIQNLLDAIANNRDELMARMQLADMTRSAGRAIMVDADTEDFTRVATPLGGVGDILDRFQQRLAAAAEMPVTLLMGRSPAGQNATGDSDFRAWYGSVKSEQTNTLKPILVRAYTILSKGNPPEGLDIEFHPLWEQTAEEQARTENMRAQTDKIYTIDIGAVGPEQVAIARFGTGKGQIQINEEFLRNSITVEENFSSQLEEARKGLTEKELAALSIAQGVSPIIVSSLINAAGKEAAAPTGPNNGKSEEPKPDAG